VAAEWGSEGDAQARVLSRRFDGNLRLVLRDSAQGALAAVAAGEADAAIVDAVSLALFGRTGQQMLPVGEPLRRDPYVIVLPIDAPRLAAEVNAALAALSADGTVAELKAHWLGVDIR
jgi:ABC-type amino acid transport substrate-binding protein